MSCRSGRLSRFFARISRKRNGAVIYKINEHSGTKCVLCNVGALSTIGRSGCAALAAWIRLRMRSSILGRIKASCTASRAGSAKSKALKAFRSSIPSCCCSTKPFFSASFEKNVTRVCCSSCNYIRINDIKTFFCKKVCNDVFSGTGLPCKPNQLIFFWIHIKDIKKLHQAIG